MCYLLAILSLLPCISFAQGEYADIEYVSVDTTSQSRVLIQWKVTPTLPNQSYTIYKWEGKWNNLTSVSEGSSENRSYTDVKAHPFEKPERYTISTSIPGQKDSPLSNLHQTIFLQNGDYDKCERTLQLHWSAYIGVDVKNYSVYGKILGEEYELFGRTADTIFTTQQLNSGTNYNFLIVANLENNYTSLSNIITYTTFEPKPLDESLVIIDSIFNRQGEIEVVCKIDTMADLFGYALKSNQGTDTIFQNPVADVINCKSNDFIQGVKISAIDFCSEEQFSTNFVYPIVIKAVTNVKQIIINWNKSLGDGELFSIYCSIDGAPEIQIATSISDLNYEIDCSQIADESAQNFCIRIESTLNQQFSQSNTICVELLPEVSISNAFTPNGDGVNDTFGPIIQNAQMSDFEFIIFDRYNGRVFSTTNQTERWDGTCRGSYVAEGGYVYYLKIKLQNGQEIEKKGAVNVIYP